MPKIKFIRFTVRVFREHLSICVCISFPYGFEDGMWDLIVLVPDYCYLFIYLDRAVHVCTLYDRSDKED